jgi:hypothetical protein
MKTELRRELFENVDNSQSLNSARLTNEQQLFDQNDDHYRDVQEPYAMNSNQFTIIDVRTVNRKKRVTETINV